METCICFPLQVIRVVCADGFSCSGSELSDRIHSRIQDGSFCDWPVGGRLGARRKKKKSHKCLATQLLKLTFIGTS